MSDQPAPLSPRDFALLLLASGDVSPRQRARDQQADRAGLSLKRRLLLALAERDPEAADLEAVLFALVAEVGPPTGPTRAVAVELFSEWRAAASSPRLVEHLLDSGMRNSH